MKNEIITIYFWNTFENKEIAVSADLESIIKNPSGYKMDHIGLVLLNRERRRLGLAEYELNRVTGTFDEVSR